MREIKYRGKRVDNSEWVYGYVYHDQRFNNGVSCCDVMIIRDECDEDFEVKENTVGQCTGRIDESDVEIYEDDKVVVEGDNEEPGVVVWDDDELEWGIDVGNIRMKMGCFYSRDIAIIGNVHDNPELLEV